MTIRKFLCLFTFTCLLSVFHTFAVEIVPRPVSVVETGGRVQLSKNITFNAGAPELGDLVSVWGETFAPITSAGETKTKMHADVLLLIDGDLEAEEYNLQIVDAPNKVVISGGSTAGVWWGLQTLAQILIQSRYDVGFNVPCLSISDKPFFSYRGGMLDCCRHFFSVDEVKRFIDILALHKLNVFHWHLTEDQGWRIEIKKYPLLTEVGSMRKETAIVYDKQSTEHDGIPYGGFYTQDEIRDIVKYAADRQMTIIPEIEMPGHAMAALASYPELGCKGEDYEVRTITSGIADDIFCAGNDNTLKFLQDVLDEVCELFPSEYIHVGGDEAPIIRWEECSKCQAKKKELGLEKTEYLHGYLLRAIEEHLNTKGRKIMGWDEVLDADVTPTATIMSWRGSEGGIRAAKQGNYVVMSPNTHYYFNRYQTKNPETHGELAKGGYLPLSKTYTFDPFEGLDEEQKHYIIGIQASLWTAYIPTFECAQRMLLPRCCGLSEVAWSSEKEDFAAFHQRVVDVMVPMYEALGLGYAEYGLNE